MLPPKYVTINQSISSLQTHNNHNIIMREKTGLLNVTQGSYKFYVRSPAGSHLSKLVVTPAMVNVGTIQILKKMFVFSLIKLFNSCYTSQILIHRSAIAAAIISYNLSGTDYSLPEYKMAAPH